MTNYLRAISLSLFLMFVSHKATAATFIVTEIPNGSIIKIDGPIEEHDYDKFAYYLVMTPNIRTVILNSNGGLVVEGIRIGQLIHDRKLNTVIDKNEVCLSICSLIFLSGDGKYIYKTSALGVHTASNPKTKQRDDKANAMIAWYFGSLGYSPGIVEKWIFSEPDAINFITYKDNVEFNLGITSLDGQD